MNVQRQKLSYSHRWLRAPLLGLLLAASGIVASDNVAGAAVSVVGAPAAAAQSCTPGSVDSPAGTVILPGSCWMSGDGVDVKSNGGVGAPGPFQCVDLVKRLYVARGWAVSFFPRRDFED